MSASPSFIPNQGDVQALLSYSFLGADANALKARTAIESEKHLTWNQCPIAPSNRPHKKGGRMKETKLELQIQRELVAFLKARTWHVERMLANAYQTGIPDLYCYHKRWGERRIEVKRPDEYSFTRWTKVEMARVGAPLGIPIWILTAATQDQYDLLFKSPNWREFWKRSFDVPDVDAMIDELARGRIIPDIGQGGAVPASGANTGCRHVQSLL